MSSTTAGSSNSSRYLDFDEYVDLKLQKTRSTIKMTDIMVALAGVAAMFLGYLLIFVVCDQWLVPGGFGIGLRWTLLSTLLVLTAAWLVWKVGMPYLRSVNRLYAANEIEKADPDLKSNLLNLIDLRASGRDVDPSILRALEKNAAMGLQRVDVAQAIDHRPLMRMAYILLAVVLVFCFYALLTPKKISNSIWRSLFPWGTVDVATQTEIVNVLPGNATILMRQTVQFSADISGDVPDKVWLLYTTADGKFRDEPVELRTDGEGPTRFKGNVPNVMQDLTYVVRAGDAVSKSYRITVDQPPSATVDRVQFQFPAYTKLEALEQARGQIDALEGTKVTVSAHTNIPVKTAKIEFLDVPGKSNGEEVTLSVSGDGQKLTASWTLNFRSDGSFSKWYQIQVTTESGANDPSPTPYTVNIRPDLPPEVAFLEPVRNLDVPANVVVPLLIEARDPDFELSHINLHIKKNGQVLPKEPLSEGRQQRLLLKHDLRLDRFVLKPGDQVEIWVQAFDNKQPRNNVKTTPELKLTIVEPISDTAAKQKQAEDTATRDQRLKEAEQEQNSDSKELTASDRTDDARPQDPQRPEDKLKPPMPQPENTQADNKEQQSGTGGNSKTKSEPGQTDKGNDSTTSQAKKEQQSGKDPSPNSDGSDDPKVLEQLIKDLVKPNEQTGGGQESQPKSNSSSNTDKSEEQKPNEPKTEDQPTPNDSTQQAPKTGTKEPKPANPTKPESGTETSQAKKPDSSQTNPKPGEDPTAKPDNPANPQQPQKPDAAKPPKTTDPKAGPKTPEKAVDPKTTPKPEAGTNPGVPKPEQKSDQPGNPGEQGPMPEKKPMPGGQENPQPGPGKDPGNPGDQPGPAGNDSTTPKKPMTTPKTGETEPTPGAETKPADKPGPDAPKSKGTTGEDQEAVENAKDPVQKTAKGNETGIAKPETDPKQEATPSTNPDLKRDPKDKPATRPGETKPMESNDPATSPAKNEVKPPSNKTPRTDEEKIKIDQPATPKQEPGKNEQKRDGTPNAQNTPKPDPGKPELRSKSGQGGTGGTSKQDPNGDPGSKDPGEGDKVNRPGTQEATDKDTDTLGEAKPGEKKEGPGGKKADGGKQDSNQPGKDSSKSGTGTESGTKPSKGGGEGSGNAEGKPGQGKPGSAGGKPGGGPGKTGQFGGGGGAPDGQNETPAANGGTSEGAVEGDEANLEYNKQASELVLKRLQSTLERGDVDPELLKKLGWTQDELQSFTERLAKQLQDAKSADETPESIARRQQFEEMLKTLKPNKQGVTQGSDNAVHRDANLIDSRRANVPKEYRTAADKFSRELTRQKAKPQK